MECGPESSGSSSRKIQSKPSKKTLKLHLGIKRAKSPLIVQLGNKKIRLGAFFYSRYVPGLKDKAYQCGADKKSI